MESVSYRIERGGVISLIWDDVTNFVIDLVISPTEMFTLTDSCHVTLDISRRDGCELHVMQ